MSTCDGKERKVVLIVTLVSFMQFYLRLMKCLSASVFTTGRLCTLNRAPTPYDRYLYHHFLVQWKVAEFMGVLEG